MLSIGLMSGTSMDGIDAALIKTNGKTAIHALGFTSYRYPTPVKILLKAAELAAQHAAGDLRLASHLYPKAINEYLYKYLNITDANQSAWRLKLAQALNTTPNIPTFLQVVHYSTWLHARLVQKLLAKTCYTSKQIDVIGYHGQTLLHKPEQKITIQVGDGKMLAELTGITVINNFRQHDVACGGLGAPLTPLFHRALAMRDKLGSVVVVNCGGIANVSLILGCRLSDMVGFDTGPGNALLDRYLAWKTQCKQTMDKNGLHGLQGKANSATLEALYNKAVSKNGLNYFNLPPPKSLDSDDMHLIPELHALSIADTCATLAAFTADTIVNGVTNYCACYPKKWILVGGGWNNLAICHELSQRLGKHCQIAKAEQIGWQSQAIEAQAFAYLAIRCLHGWPISFPKTTGVSSPMTGGQAYIPSCGTTARVSQLLSLNSIGLAR